MVDSNKSSSKSSLPSQKAKVGLYSKDSKQVSQALLRLEKEPPKRTVLQQTIPSQNGLRIWCFNTKRSLILSPGRYLIVSIFIGFIVFVIPICTALILTYEKLADNVGTYSGAITPLVILGVALLASNIVVIGTMGRDLLMNGCLTWHRDAFGYIIQNLVFSIIALIAASTLQGFVAQVEAKSETKDAVTNKEVQNTILEVFIPIIVFMCFIACKVALINMRHSTSWIVIVLSTIFLAIMLNQKYDLDGTQVSNIYIGLPIAVIAMAFQINYLIDAIWGSDVKAHYLGGTESKPRKFVIVFETIFTAFLALYLVFESFSLDNAFGKEQIAIYKDILVAFCAFFLIQMEHLGSFYINMVTQHLDYELIPDIRPPKQRSGSSQAKKKKPMNLKDDSSDEESVIRSRQGTPGTVLQPKTGPGSRKIGEPARQPGR